MAKREAEGKVGRALREADLASFVFKPSDRDVNPKPADFFVWARGCRPAWVEVKDDGVHALSLIPSSLLEPSQRRGVEQAVQAGVGYHLVVWMRRRLEWLILDLSLMLREGMLDRRWKYEELHRWGTTTTSSALSSTLRLILLGES